MRVALIGGGVIGGGWAGRLVENGVDVVRARPAPGGRAAEWREVLENAERAWARLRARPPGAWERDLRTHARGSGSGCGSDPGERAGGRGARAAAAGRGRGPTRPRPRSWCSSTSGLLPSRAAGRPTCTPTASSSGTRSTPSTSCRWSRSCRGCSTSADAVARAMSFYASLGMRPLLVRKEIEAFLADRLLEALWREALWLVHDDVATVEEVDDSIRYGAGLRWAQMGTFLTYRIAGGEDGIDHFLAQFGPALRVALDEADRRAGADGRACGPRSPPSPTSRPQLALGAGARASARRQSRRPPPGAPFSALRGGRPCSNEHEARLFGATAGGQEASPDPGLPLRFHDGRRRPVVGGLQRPHDRGPVPRRLRRCDRRLSPPHRRGRALPRCREQRVRGRDAHPAPTRGRGGSSRCRSRRRCSARTRSACTSSTP